MEINIENNGLLIALASIGIFALIIAYTEATMKGVITLLLVIAIAIVIYKTAMKIGAIGDLKHIQTRIKNYNLRKRIKSPKLRELKQGEKKKKEKWNIHW